MVGYWFRRGMGYPPFTKEELRTLLKEERLSVAEAADELDVSKNVVLAYKSRWLLDRNPANEAEKRLDPVIGSN